MLFKRAIIVNLGGTAEVVISDFCPFMGQKSFYFAVYCRKHKFRITNSEFRIKL